jgi:uncharacterized protein (TIGR03435 family)
MLKRAVWLATVLFVAGFGLATAQAPRFEAAVLKPNTLKNGGVEGGCHGIDSKFAPDDPAKNVPLGRCVITASRLSHLLSLAYSVPIQRISGLPDWDRPNRYNVEAEAESPATTTEAQLLAMLQGFLKERFNLNLHRSPIAVPGFALVVAKQGPKLQPSAQEASSAPEFQGAAMILKGYTMADFARFLSGMPSIGRQVVDMTGLHGRYNLTLNILDARPDANANMKSLIGNWRSAITDVQDQLGLRFKSRTILMDRLIIEHAEKPRPDTN